MFSRYLPQAQINDVRQAILETLGYDSATRNALTAGLPINYRSLLPGSGNVPPIALQLDLDQLNTTRRLVGEDLEPLVPLRMFLDTALGFTAGQEQAVELRSALADVDAVSTGAAPVAVTAADVAEAVVARDDMVPVTFLSGGVTASRAVARLLVPRFENDVPKSVNGKPLSYRGTGWLLGPDLLMTNHHVVNARERGEPAASESDLRRQTAAMDVVFDYDHVDATGTQVPVSELVAWDSELDFALVRLTGADRPPLSRATTAVADVSPSQAVAVNIIQHPDGRPKLLGIRNNLVSAATPTELRYFTDTLGGSSGSPVLDDTWTVVGLHRGAVLVRGVKFQGHEVAYLNVGTQITAIMDSLQTTHAGQLTELGI